MTPLCQKHGRKPLRDSPEAVVAMQRPRFEVADIFRQYGSAYLEHQGEKLSSDQRRVLHAVATCRTAVLGGHIEACDQCGVLQISYNSCANRHCPKCQAVAKAKWLEKRLDELLPVEYFHLVFTVPRPIAEIALQNKRVVYNILFRTAAEALRTIARDPKHLGAVIGFLAVLHTWGQNLMDHPHLHCVVPGGGLDPSGKRWVACRPGFFLPVRVLSRLFRRLFLQAMGKAFKKGELQFHGRLRDLKDPKRFQEWLKPARKTEWVVYCKKPFGGPEKVFTYLGRYTHRVAISNHRILDMSDGKVTFSWRDYRRDKEQRTLTLDAEEFIRRFLLHTLPSGFVRIRQYGFLANRNRTANIQKVRDLLQEAAGEERPEEDWKQLLRRLTKTDPTLCPVCGEGRLVCIEVIESQVSANKAMEEPRRGPPGGGLNTS